LRGFTSNENAQTKIINCLRQGFIPRRRPAFDAELALKFRGYNSASPPEINRMKQQLFHPRLFPMRMQHIQQQHAKYYPKMSCLSIRGNFVFGPVNSRVLPYSEGSAHPVCSTNMLAVKTDILPTLNEHQWNQFQVLLWPEKT
jgi:hypothetical protein